MLRRQLSALLLLLPVCAAVPVFALPGLPGTARNFPGNGRLRPLHPEATAPRIGPDPVFTSELAAVRAATDRYNPLSVFEDREFMGAILERDGQFIYTVGAGDPGRDSITVTLTIPKGFSVRAFWHTHGGPGHSRRFFSDADTHLARSHKKPFYLADYTGSLRVFRPPGKTISAHRAQRLGLPKRNGYATGEIVLDQAGEAVRVSTVS